MTNRIAIDASAAADAPCHAEAGLSVRFWRPDDTPAIQTFYNDPRIRPSAGARGATPRTDAQWNWEFTGYQSQDPAYVVATVDDRIIGTHACIPIPMLCDGRRIATGKDEETLVHPDYRGRGVLDAMYRPQLQRARADGIEMLWGFTSTAVRPLLRNGFSCLGPFAAMRWTLPRGGRFDGSPGDSTAHRRIVVQRLETADPISEAFSYAFAAQVGGLTLHLSKDYLDWRVFCNPFRSYLVFAAWDTNRLIGLGIFKLEPHRGLAFVSDLVAMDAADLPREDIWQALLAAGISAIADLGIKQIEARASGPHPYNLALREFLARRGFEPVPDPNAVSFLVRPVASENTCMLDQGFWRICELMREY